MLVADEAQQLLARVVLLDDGVADVGAVETADELARLLQLQAFDDVGTCQRIGRGGQGHAGHAWVTLVQHRQGSVFGAEIMPPLADAMRFVNGKQRHLPALGQGIELRQEARRGDALRCRVQQREFTAQQALLHCGGFHAAEAGVQKGGFHAGFVQGAHLVVHQGDQRRDHDGGAVAGLLACDGRDLVAQGLTAAGGHQHQRVAAGHHMLNDGLLRAAESVIAKNLAQDVQERQVLL